MQEVGTRQQGTRYHPRNWVLNKKITKKNKKLKETKNKIIGSLEIQRLGCTNPRGYRTVSIQYGRHCARCFASVQNGVCVSWGVFCRCCCSCFKLQIASVPARDLQLISSFELLNQFIFGIFFLKNSELLQKIVFYFAYLLVYLVWFSWWEICVYFSFQLAWWDSKCFKSLGAGKYFFLAVKGFVVDVKGN